MREYVFGFNALGGTIGVFFATITGLKVAGAIAPCENEDLANALFLVWLMASSTLGASFLGWSAYRAWSMKVDPLMVFVIPMGIGTLLGAATYFVIMNLP